MTRQRPSWVVLAAAGAIGISSLFLPQAAAHAAGDPAIVIQNMSIDMRPEYDTSDVLLIYDFALLNNDKTPYTDEVSLHVPKGATNQVHICEQVGDNKHATCRPYNTKDDGESTLMTWKPSNPIEPGQAYPIYVEYYYNPIRGTTDKTIDFTYHPSYPVQKLQLGITQPQRSSNWKLSPAPQSSGGTGDGMTQYHYSWQDLPAGESVTVAIRYTKADNKPSVAQQATDLSTTSGLSTGVRMGIGLGVATIFVGLLFLGLRRPVPVKPDPAQARTAGRPVRTPLPAPRSEPAVHRTQKEPDRPGKVIPISEQRRKARLLLLEGKITEATYQSIIADLDVDSGGAS